MRELLSDLEAGKHLSDPDPVQRARNQMRTPLPKRFYEKATSAETEAGHLVQLDGKPVRTPGRAHLALPNADVAALVVEEFNRQADEIDPMTMPVLRLANTAIDGVAADMQAVLEDILRFASTDLLCYRADAPAGLVERQNELWDPYIDWARSALGARFLLAEGVMHVDQPREAIAALGIALKLREDPFRLTGLHVMTSLTGSALLALAVDSDQAGADEAWRAAHVDEDWNIHQWGEDAEAAARRAARHLDFEAAVKLVKAL